MINGLDGADMLDGMGGSDTVSYENSDRGVTVTVNADGEGSVSGGHAQGDTITNFENATGSAHDDNLNGEVDAATANTLKGLAGDDEIIGGAGSRYHRRWSWFRRAGRWYKYRKRWSCKPDQHIMKMVLLTLPMTTEQIAMAIPCPMQPQMLLFVVNLASLTFTGGHAEGDEIEVERMLMTLMVWKWKMVQGEYGSG